MPDPVTGALSPWRRFTAAYAAFLRFLVVLSVAILVIPVSLQIFSRLTDLIPSYIWTERCAVPFIWTIMIGSMIGVREAAHFEVDLLPQTAATRRGAGADHWPAWRSGLGAGLCLGWAGNSPASPSTDLELAEMPLWLIHMAWLSRG